MMQIKIESKSPVKEIIKEIKDLDKFIKQEMDVLGYQTQDKMREVIQTNKVRPQAGQPTLLENAITVEFFEDGWGVGSVDVLQKDAPYWPAINFGSSHMVGKRVAVGEFIPTNPEPSQEAFRTGRWSEGAGGYSFIVKRPIPAMNFIEKTVFWLSEAFKSKFQGR